jgi:hypothetical protein
VKSPDAPRRASPGSATSADVDQLRFQGAPWRTVGKALGISAATAIRLSRADRGICSKTQDTCSKTPEEGEEMDQDQKLSTSGVINADRQGPSKERAPRVIRKMRAPNLRPNLLPVVPTLNGH